MKVAGLADVGLPGRLLQLATGLASRAGLEFLRLWPPLAWSVPGLLGPASSWFLYRAARGGPGRGAIVEIGSAWGRSAIVLARGSRAAGRERVYAIDPHEQAAHLDLTRAPYLDQRLWYWLLTRVARQRQLDLEYLRRFGTAPALIENARRFGVGDRVVPLVCTSEAALARGDVGPIRLLFVDGDHSYAGVRGDIDGWVPRVVDGGLVIFDDYFLDAPDNGVRRAVDELLAGGRVDPRLRQAGSLAWTRRRGVD